MSISHSGVANKERLEQINNGDLIQTQYSSIVAPSHIGPSIDSSCISNEEGNYYLFLTNILYLHYACVIYITLYVLQSPANLILVSIFGSNFSEIVIEKF